MKILIEESTGRCIGYGAQDNWPHQAPDWIDFGNYNRWVCSNLNDIANRSNWTEEDQPVASDSFEEVLADRGFGQQILNEYLAQNRALNLTTTQSITQLSKFGTSKQLLEAGAIKAVSEIISTIPVDEIFTQVRKDYFIAKLQQYLNS